MAKSGTLGNGPIDLQYMQHIKQISRDRIASRNVSLLKSRERSRASNSTNEGLVGTIPEDNIII
jgi:hypothetical protein